MKQIYLDYAAATPLDPDVLTAMTPYLTENFYNPSATYLAGRTVRRDLESARSSVAQILGAKPAEIIFTAGATEANNLAIRGLVDQFPSGEIAILATEHDSVLAPAKLYKGRLLKVKADGLIDLTNLKEIITDKTFLVSVGYVNNETGVIQPLREISEILRQIRNQRSKKANKLPIFLHTDAAQAPSYLGLHVSKLGVDMMTINGGKIYGPKQSGVLYVKAGLKLKPIILGGGQESGLRSGTENIANFVGLAAALAQAAKQRQTQTEKLSSIKQEFVTGLQSMPQAKINGSLRYSSPHIVNASFKGADNERLMMQLDEAGVQVAVGSACSASSRETSHVLKAMGLSDEEIRSSLRFSFGRQTKKSDISQTLQLLQKFTSPKK